MDDVIPLDKELCECGGHGLATLSTRALPGASRG